MAPENVVRGAEEAPARLVQANQQIPPAWDDQWPTMWHSLRGGAARPQL